MALPTNYMLFCCCCCCCYNHNFVVVTCCEWLTLFSLGNPARLSCISYQPTHTTTIYCKGHVNISGSRLSHFYLFIFILRNTLHAKGKESSEFTTCWIYGLDFLVGSHTLHSSKCGITSSLDFRCLINLRPYHVLFWWYEMNETRLRSHAIIFVFHGMHFVFNGLDWKL